VHHQVALLGGVAKGGLVNRIMRCKIVEGEVKRDGELEAAATSMIRVTRASEAQNALPKNWRNPTPENEIRGGGDANNPTWTEGLILSR